MNISTRERITIIYDVLKKTKTTKRDKVKINFA